MSTLREGDLTKPPKSYLVENMPRRDRERARNRRKATVKYDETRNFVSFHDPSIVI